MPNRAYQNRVMVDINSEKSYRSEELVNSFSREIFSKLKLESSEWNCTRFRPKLTQYDVAKTDCFIDEQAGRRANTCSVLSKSHL